MIMKSMREINLVVPAKSQGWTRARQDDYFILWCIILSFCCFSRTMRGCRSDQHCSQVQYSGNVGITKALLIHLKHVWLAMMRELAKVTCECNAVRMNSRITQYITFTPKTCMECFLCRDNPDRNILQPSKVECDSGDTASSVTYDMSYEWDNHKISDPTTGLSM